MTKGWPSVPVKRSATRRMMNSVGPPGANGTTIFTGRVG
jgi:hypothetical protein